MNTMRMPACCGMNLSMNFGSALGQSTVYSTEEVDAYLAEQTENAVDNQLAIIQVNLNDEQYRIHKAVLKRHGYKMVMKAYHPNHFSFIYVMLRNTGHAPNKTQ